MLGAMAREFFEASPVLAFPVAAMFLFLATFSLVTWRVMRRPSAEMESMARLPLGERAASTVAEEVRS